MPEKIMHYANFNVTFGPNDEPMLTHFADIVFPAFLEKDFRRVNSGGMASFYVSDVEIKEINDEYVLVGNYIKDTQYNVLTTIQDGKLVDSPQKVPTAPYSRFIIFLKNHKMILIRNEGKSPDVRSFQVTVNKMLHHYVRQHNLKEENKNQRLPYAFVNIVDIPLPNDIEEVLKTIKQVKKLRMKFFPLNNDINPELIARGIDEQMKKTKSKHALLEFTSPESKKEIQGLLNSSSGLATVAMDVIDSHGNKTRIKEDSFVSQKQVPLSQNIEPANDAYFIEQAMSDPVVKQTSDENRALYERFKPSIKKIIDSIRMMGCE